MLLLCDSGGSNNYRHYIFKEDLQRLVNRLDLPIQVAHYPPYCSKYNPIEHRLFPHVTRACQGVVFHTMDVVKALMEKTRTGTGLADVEVHGVPGLDDHRRLLQVGESVDKTGERSTVVEPTTTNVAPTV